MFMTNLGRHMYKYSLPLIAVALSACGGGTTVDPNDFTTKIDTGTPVVAPQAKSFINNGSGSFTLAPGTSSMTLTRTSSNTTADQTTWQLTVGGTTYDLSPAPNNSPTSSSNSFIGSAGGTTATMFLNENSANASIVNAQLVTGGSSEEYFGIIGDATPTGTLAGIGSATYSGVGEISIDKAGGAFDDAPATTVSLNVDFGAGTLNGGFNVTDGAEGGSVDINGTTTLPVTGTVSGNSFSATVDYTNLVGITTGMNSINSPQAVEGGFYGPNAENAVGVGLSIGQSTGANDDLLIYTRIQAGPAVSGPNTGFANIKKRVRSGPLSSF